MDPPDYAQLLKKGDRILDNVTRITASLDEFLAGGESTGRRNLNEALRSLRRTLVEVEKGQGLLHDIIYGREGAELLARMDRTAQSLEAVARSLESEGGPLLSRGERTVQSLENIAKALETEDGLLHALIYTPKDETLGRLTQSLNTLDEILRQARDGRGLLHMLLYESEGAELLARLNRTSEHLEGLARAAREGLATIAPL